jgi:hypothetical protein
VSQLPAHAADPELPAEVPRPRPKLRAEQMGTGWTVIKKVYTKTSLQLRIPTKKIIRSELMTIRTSPKNAGESIVDEVIVMGQEKVVHASSIISFLPRFAVLPAQSLREHAIVPPSS